MKILVKGLTEKRTPEVYLLSKLDPNNITWKHRQLEAATRDREKAALHKKVTK